MTLTDFANRLQAKKRGSYFSAKCPAHEDSHPSLSIWEEAGWIKMRCHACGASDKEILPKMGLDNEALRTPNNPIQYTYKDSAGVATLRKKRLYGEDGRKTFRQEGIKNGKWVASKAHLNGQANLLYHLPEVLQGIKDGKTIYLNEGEKAADAICGNGGIGTCQPDGANGEWTEEHRSWLKGADLVIVADKDDAGATFAHTAAKWLRKAVKSVRIVESVTDGAKDDAFDHLIAGHGLADLVSRPDLMPVYGFDVRLIEEYDIEGPEFLWEPYLRTRQINLIDAKGGTGKTRFGMALAVQGSIGCLPFQAPGRHFKTLYFGKEDSPGELRKVYQELGGRNGFLYPCAEDFRLNKEGLEMVEDTIQKTGATLVIFDAITYYVSGLIKNPFDGMQIEPYLSALRAIAMRTGACIMNIRHFAKTSKDRSAEDFGAGASQWRDSHRSQLVLIPHPDQQANPGLVVIQHLKAGINVRKGEPFGFTFNDGEFGWIKEVDPSVFDEPAKKRGRPTTADMEKIEEWLGDILMQGGIRANVILAQGAEMGMSRASIYRAKAKMGIKSVRPLGERLTEDSWIWMLYEEPDPETYYWQDA